MTFLNLGYLPFVILAIALFWFLTLRVEKNYFKWVLDHWFFKRSRSSRIASVFYFGGFLLILLALLDLRGPEKRVTGKVSDQKTVILIDASASMLAEDVRPNRFEKAVLLAKHFIKKAAGHQISVVVFSDGQKRIVPFTKDKDLVEARLDTLENLDLERGGTGLSLAIQESIQYFINAENRPFGNILVLTDAEETDGGFELDVPDGVSVAVIGIGTAKGAPIPIRSPRGQFRGNKKFQGETVISKLDENFLKGLGKEVEHFKYWVASSYTIPTEDVLSFFNRALKTKVAKDDFRIRPVLANYLMVPGMLALVLAFLLKNFPSFGLALLLLVCVNVRAQEQGETEPEKTPLILELEKRFAKNELDEKGKKKLATELLKNGFPSDAKNLYEEILPERIDEGNLQEKFNYGASQFKSQDIAGGMQTYSDLMEYLENNPSSEHNALLEKAKKNVLKAIQAQSQSKSKKQQSSDEKKDQNKDQKDQNQKGEQGDDQKKQDGKDGNQNDKKKEDKNSGDQDKNKKDQDGDKNDKDQKDRKDKKKGDQKGDAEQKKKMPSILKQLMSDDNQLQKKVIDAETVKRKTREKKDW